MRALLLNAGSSSLKCSLMESAAGLVIGHIAVDVPGRGYAEALRHALADLLPARERGALAAVGHRIVHGGPFTDPVRIDPEVRTRIRELAELAPLHNPPGLETLAAAEAELPDTPHVAVFDTAFHASLPPEASTYAVPAAWTRDWRIRRYGFHGLSYAWCARRAAQMLERPGAELRLVICHLGHGCSAAAVRGGRSIDTTMGFTPLEGLVMATRSGSLDPGIVLHVQQRHGLSPQEVERALNRESGLLGLSGISADLREVQAASRGGDARAQLALDVYAHRVRQAIGALTATLGGVDALVFTAGVGENSAEMRAACCRGLECLGLDLDTEANAACRPDADVARRGSRARVLVIAAREEVTMLREVMRVVGTPA